MESENEVLFNLMKIGAHMQAHGQIELFNVKGPTNEDNP